MKARPDHAGLSPMFANVLYQVALTALAQASFVLVACVLMGALSGRGVGAYLPVAGFGFSLVGGFVLSRGLTAERNSAPAHAGNLYAVALVNYAVSYASFLSGRLVGTLGGS